MRILAIRGANLASLAAPFEIDLAAEPLAGSGLFAITGETGAGKSTILDALCLALYGEYPRVSIGRRENAPDPSGEAISIHDGRAILRRGAGGGYAEVDFVGKDGERYRVRWEANRARGRANGRLQNEQRALFRLDDGSTVAAGKTQVREAVEARTDLTFDQFRRTVLLAQGEFDTFLLAAESERAELLEKITGTEIYAAISIRVHEGTEARRRTVEQLQQRRSDIGLLDDDARQRLLDEQSQLAEAVAQKAAECDRQNERLDHFKRVVSARSDLAQAEAQATAARLAREAAADDYGALAEFDLVEPLRPLSVDLDNARRTATEAESRLAELQVAREDMRTLDEAAATQLSVAVTADEAAEDIFKRFGPLWSEAEKLDAELATAQAEFNDATEKSQQADTALRNQVDALAALDKTLGQTAEAHRIAAVQLKGQPSRAILADRLGDATALLEKRVILKRDGATAASGAAEARKTEARLEGEIADLSKKLAADRDRKDGLTRDIGERRSHLAAIDEPALLERETILQRILEVLREATTACDRHIRASADLARRETELIAAAQEVSTVSGQIAEAESEQLRDRTARAEIAPLADLADQAVSPEAAHLRSMLVPDAACPVCGSTDHPHLVHPSALNDMVATVRRRRQELDAALDGISLRLGAATRALAAAEVRQAVDDAVGSAGGDRFRRFVQGITLDHLVQLANDHLNALSPRYRLARGAASDLTLHIIDRDMGDEVRATRSLSGGERFLVSLALALALSGLEGRASFVDTLFIDEGFGSLDAETLDMAVDALETLQGRGQKVGVITHVAAMIDRIGVQVRVEKRGAGRSEIRISNGLGPTWSAAGASTVQ